MKCHCLKLRWINKLTHIFDVHFAPLKHKHQFLFGVLLLAQGILLVSFASTYVIHQRTNMLLLLTSHGATLLYMTTVQPYKSTAILIVQSFYLLNLIILSGFILYSNTYKQAVNKHTLQAVAVGISTGIVFPLFCGITVYRATRICSSRTKTEDNTLHKNRDEHKMVDEFSTNYHDSILIQLTSSGSV